MRSAVMFGQVLALAGWAKVLIVLVAVVLILSVLCEMAGYSIPPGVRKIGLIVLAAVVALVAIDILIRFL